ncbi:MAG: alcohol dehydrogenase [Verrucomicrobiae bacterium]|nr:alcohol dehydrogenase [Verrucomicrobiae bacterium]
MKKSVTVVCIREVGSPLDVVRVEKWELPGLQPHQVVVEMKAAPINPADINVLEGKYIIRPTLPAVIGNEGVGIVAECGSAVTNLKVGQRVIAPARMGSWCDAYVSDANELIPVPSDIPIEQAAMLAVNPPTAWRMLHDIVPLKHGDWVIQNAANSGVGRSVIQIAKAKGWRTVNVVRRKELIDELKAEGADVVITDEQPFAKQVRELTGGAELLLGLNAVGGDNAREVSKALSAHGTLVTYGAMSKQPILVDNGSLIFKDVRFRGYLITEWYRRASRQQKVEMIGESASLMKQGKVKSPVEKTYRLEEAKEAVRHASQDKRGGKILFVMK